MKDPTPLPDTPALPEQTAPDETPTLPGLAEIPCEEEDEAIYFEADGDPAPAYTFGPLLGRGGYGDVVEATQTSLGRRVAIKRLRGDVWEKAAQQPGGQAALEAGFRKEAFIMASLEHPGIPPIHDMMLDASGRPMLIMKLVRGLPWDQAIRRDFFLPASQYLTRHLGIFVSVAQAVAFAHSRQIIHRDIKPSQVMVGEYGEVQLMDWGIALTATEIRQVRAEIAKLRTGTAGPPPRQLPSGTAAFMAPEQTRNHIGEIGPWTDVFLLGGTLYFMLTGRTPYNPKDAREAFVQARLGKIVPPNERTPDRHIPEELAAITMRALHPDPPQRFLSVEPLIEAVQDYLTGQSRQREAEALLDQAQERLETGACSYSDMDDCQALLDQAAARWPAHPRLPEMRAEVARRTLREALGQGDLGMARTQLLRLPTGQSRDEFRGELEAQEDEKRQAADRLRRALEDAKSLVAFMLDDLYVSLQGIGRLDLMEKVARKALEHFDAFPEDTLEGDQLLARLETMGHIAGVLKSQGRLAEAERILEESIQKARFKMNGETGGPAEPWALLMSDQMAALAEVLYDQGDLLATRQWHNEALRLRTRGAANAPRSAEWRWRIAASRHALSVTAWREGRQEDALAEEEEALAILSELRRESPGNTAVLGLLARSRSGRGWVLRAQGDSQLALRELREALQLRMELADLAPGNLDQKAEVAWAQRSVALVQEDLHEYQAALASYYPALESCLFLVKADPANPRRQMELAFTFGGMGRVQQALGQLEEAQESYRQGCQIQRLLSQEDPTNVRLLREYVYNIIGLSSVLLEQEALAGALREAQTAVRVSRAISSQLEGNNPYLGELLGRALVQLGLVKRALGEKADADDHFREAAALLRALFATGNYPAVQEEPLALALLLLDRYEEARPVVERLQEKGWRGRLFRRLVDEAGL